MAWRIEFEERAAKDLEKLDPPVVRRILGFLQKRLLNLSDPRDVGEALSGNLGEIWRYRVGDYRIICKLEDESITVLVLKIGHRSKVYRF